MPVRATANKRTPDLELDTKTQYTSELSEWRILGYPLGPGYATLNVLISLCFLNTNGTSFSGP